MLRTCRPLYPIFVSFKDFSGDHRKGCWMFASSVLTSGFSVNGASGACTSGIRAEWMMAVRCHQCSSPLSYSTPSLELATSTSTRRLQAWDVSLTYVRAAADTYRRRSGAVADVKQLQSNRTYESFLYACSCSCNGTELPRAPRPVLSSNLHLDRQGAADAREANRGISRTATCRCS